MQRDPIELNDIPSPDMASALRAASPRIAEKWVAAVRHALPDADQFSIDQIRDNLDRVFEEMVAALTSGTLESSAEIKRVASLHGAERHQIDFNLREVMFEYDLLRRIVVREVADELKRMPAVEEIIAINAGIDVVLRRCVMEFTAQQAKEVAASAEAQAKHLSFLSHDLRGSLNGILLMIEVLKRELQQHESFAESLEDLDVMRRSILETVTTMDRFLYAERFRKGKVVVKNGPVNVAQLVDDVIAQFSYQARDKELPLKSEIPPSTQITTDRALVNVTLQNLIGNAVKFTRRGSITVSSAQPAPGFLRITVADTGPGIDPSKLEKLFAPFTRGETHGQDGSGLGLSIARQAADLMGAKLWADSAPGKGSQFHLELKDAKP
jgi:signal transduction histidine kinase